MAANIGADSLVPQDAVQPPCPPVKVSKTFTATLHDALIEMSGNNTVSFSGTTVHGYSVRHGYNLVTGLGTVNGQDLVPELAHSA